MRRWFALLLLIGVAGCTPLFGPDYPGFTAYGQTRVDPEIWYPEWEEIRECAVGLSYQPLPAGVFMIPPATDEPYAGFACSSPYLCWGLYRNGQVYVVEGLGGYTGGVMRHEMLHFILDGDGSPDPDHCSPLWSLCEVANGTTCGSVSRGDHDPI